MKNKKILLKGDLVFFEYKNVVSLKPNIVKGLVLERNFLFEKNTLWGKELFFEYKIFTFKNRIIKTRSQNMKIINVRKLNENWNYW